MTAIIDGTPPPTGARRLEEMIWQSDDNPSRPLTARMRPERDDDGDVVMASNAAAATATTNIIPRPVIITNNDRSFSCNISRGRERNVPPSPLDNDFSNTFSINGISVSIDALDVNIISRDILSISKDLAESIALYKNWLTEKESAIELSYRLNHMDRTTDLFNRINNLQSKLKQGLNLLKTWQVSMQNRLTDIIIALREYQDLENDLANYREIANSNANSDFGLDVNTIKQATQKITQTNNIRRALTKIRRAESQLRGELVQYFAEIDAFNSGVLRINNRTLDLEALGKAIEGLIQEDSPLSAVQKDLAKRINSTDVKFALRTGSSKTVNTLLRDTRVRPPVDINLSYPPDLPMTLESLLIDLQNIHDTKLYTSATIDELESTLTYIENALPDNEMIKNLTTAIRSNTPERVLRELQQNIRDENGMYERISRIENILRNLHQSDRALYEHELNNLLKEARETAEELIENETRV